MCTVFKWSESFPYYQSMGGGGVKQGVGHLMTTYFAHVAHLLSTTAAEEDG